MAPDRQIWDYAFANDAVLITKDEDFITMRALNPQGPPIVWVRVGNTTRRELLQRFAAVQLETIDALQRGETVVEISGT
jgi:predicted nuclease of predicted toxin-antitoxin system